MTHGYYHAPDPGMAPERPRGPALEHLLIALASKQARVSRYLDDHLAEMEVPMLAHVFALHAKGAWRIGQVLREVRLAGGGDAVAIVAAIDQALDALSVDLGVRL